MSPRPPAALVGQLRAGGCVFAAAEAALLLEAAASPDALAGLAARRVAGEPIEQVLGWAAFAGMRVKVAPGVFVPRRRSEFLLAKAVQAAAVARAGAAAAGRLVVVDLCCGSGALGLALAHQVSGVELHAGELDPAAVACAQANLAAVGGRVHTGDLTAALPARLRGRVDVLVANAPYVPSAELARLPAEAREHEPKLALDGGPDGLAVHRRIASQLPAWLSSAGGVVLIEVTRAQAPAAAAALRAAGLRTRVLHSRRFEVSVVRATVPAVAGTRRVRHERIAARSG